MRYPMENPSTRQVAEQINISRSTLERWIANGELRPPKRVRSGGLRLRLWTPKDIERVRRLKQTSYGKGRDRKPRPRVAD